ncbi:MAG: spore cortex biosynthesis protein YabQ, partial [Clostridia bacterium]|nr:spore cortex biosynthesis protein YabQ [Clostridia bacterium]
MSGSYPELLVEASRAGDVRVIPDALLAGVLMGMLYDGLRICYMAAGLRPLAGQSALSERLSVYQKKRIGGRKKQDSTGCAVTQKEKTRGRRAWLLMILPDIFYCLICGVFASVFLYAENAGELRWYIPASMAAGFFAYYGTAGRLVMRASTGILSVL